MAARRADQIPGQPLAAFFDRRAQRSSLEHVCKRADTSVRQVNRWRRGEQPVSLNDADRALVKLNALWWDVYNPDTVREPLFVVHVYAHQMKAVRGKLKLRRVRARSVPYGDIGTDYAEINRIERLFVGEPVAA